MKQNVCILILVLFVNFSFGQTLKITDFRKAYNDQNPTDHKQLLSKGFKLSTDSILTNKRKFIFKNQNSKEIIELTFIEDGEGSEYLNIKYFLTTELTYKKFISTLPTYKFKYSKRNKRYQLPTSSYSGENISLNGLTQTDGQKYYSLEYNRYVDKALSGPRPEVRNNIEPPIESLSKSN